MSRIYAQQKRPGAKAAAPSYDAPSVHAPSLVSGQSNSDLDALMQAKYRQHFLDNQIPTAEAEADRIAASVSGARTPEEVKTQLGKKMGADFSDVTFHTDSAARGKAEAMGARAYTTGSDVYFGSGGFDPGVAAHELVHTVQQGMVGSTMATTSAPTGGVQMKPTLHEEYAARFAGLSTEQMLKELAKLNQYLHAVSQTRQTDNDTKATIQLPNEKYAPDDIRKTYNILMSNAVKNKDFRNLLASEAAISRANFQADAHTANKKATSAAEAYTNSPQFVNDFLPIYKKDYKTEKEDALQAHFDKQIQKKKTQEKYGIATKESGCNNPDRIKQTWAAAKKSQTYQDDLNAYFKKHKKTKRNISEKAMRLAYSGAMQNLYHEKYKETYKTTMNDQDMIDQYFTYDRLLDDALSAVSPEETFLDTFRNNIGGSGYLSEEGRFIRRDRQKAVTAGTLYTALAGGTPIEVSKNIRNNYDLPEVPESNVYMSEIEHLQHNRKASERLDKQKGKAKHKREKEAEKKQREKETEWAIARNKREKERKSLIKKGQYFEKPRYDSMTAQEIRDFQFPEQMTSEHATPKKSLLQKIKDAWHNRKSKS